MLKNVLQSTLLLLAIYAAGAHGYLYGRPGGMYYDDVLDITWLADANYAMTSGFDADGMMTWSEANAWAEQLVYGGFDDWRLPSARLANDGCFAYDGSCDTGYNNTTGELGYMFYVNLENTGFYDTEGNLTGSGGYVNNTFVDHTPPYGDVGYIDNLPIGGIPYWYAEGVSDFDPAWLFNMYNGEQLEFDGYFSYGAWAVRDGDVSAVPLPAAAWLFGSGLLGIGAVKRRKAA